MKTIANLDQATSHTGIQLTNASRVALTLGLIADTEIIRQSSTASFVEIVCEYRAIAENKQIGFFFDRVLRLVGYVRFEEAIDGESSQGADPDDRCVSLVRGRTLLIKSMSCRSDLLWLQFGRFLSEQVTSADKLFISTEDIFTMKPREISGKLISRVKSGFLTRQASGLTKNDNLIHQRRESFESIADFGAMLDFIQRHGSLVEQPFSSVSKLVRRLQKLGYCKLYRNSNGNVTSLLLWAWLTESNIERSIKNGLSSLHISEFSDGEHPAILMAVGPAIEQDAMFAHVLSQLPPGERSFTLNIGNLGSPRWRRFPSNVHVTRTHSRAPIQ